MNLKVQKETIELNFKHFIKILENGSDNRLYGLVIPMFEDIMDGQYFIDRHPLMLETKNFYSDLIKVEEVLSECEFIKDFQRELKDKNPHDIVRCQVMAFLLGFLETSIISKDKELVEIQNKNRKKNKKKREQKKRNKWKKPPSPSLDYKTYDWNIPDISPPTYAF
jgi:hypothetical protein